MSGSLTWRKPSRRAVVLLAYEPDFAETSAESGRFDLRISGHSYGGQVDVPLLGPPVLPPFARKYPAGLYEVGEMSRYTNRGLGVIRPRVRFGCGPELTTFVLRAGKWGRETRRMDVFLAICPGSAGVKWVLSYAGPGIRRRKRSVDSGTTR